MSLRLRTSARRRPDHASPRSQLVHPRSTVSLSNETQASSPPSRIHALLSCLLLKEHPRIGHTCPGSRALIVLLQRVVQLVLRLVIVRRVHVHLHVPCHETFCLLRSIIRTSIKNLRLLSPGLGNQLRTSASAQACAFLSPVQNCT